MAFSGDPLNLTCSAYSAPPPIYTWLKDGSPVVPSPGLVVDSGQLFIQNVSSEFTGNYTCMARTTLPENGTVLGEVASSGELRMVGPTFFTSTAGPLVYRQVKDNPRPIVLPCAIEGDEMAIFDIMWQKNGAPIPLGTDPPLSPSTNALTLTFDTWSVSDSGVYECVVSTRIKSFNSSISRVISTVTNLTIASKSKPEVVGVHLVRAMGVHLVRAMGVHLVRAIGDASGEGDGGASGEGDGGASGEGDGGGSGEGDWGWIW